jgi:uncharacterized protein
VEPDNWARKLCYNCWVFGWRSGRVCFGASVRGDWDMSESKRKNDQEAQVKEALAVYGTGPARRRLQSSQKHHGSAAEKKRIMDVMAENKHELEECYGVKKLGLFGSYVRGRQKKTSDIDILVAFARDIDLFEFIDLREYLELKIGGRVDLVMESALKPTIGKHILAEVEYV